MSVIAILQQPPSARLGRAFESLRFCLCFRASGEWIANLLHVSGVIQIVRHYNPLAFQVETIFRFGQITQSLHFLLHKMSEIRMFRQLSER